MNGPQIKKFAADMEPCNISESGPGARRPIASLADCLAHTSRNTPAGYTRILAGATGCPWEGPQELPWVDICPTTAAIEPAPVTVLITAGTTPKEARKLLKLVRQWLKTCESLEPFTPGEAGIDPVHDSLGDLPF